MADNSTKAAPKKPKRNSYLGNAQAPTQAANNMAKEVGAQMTFVMKTDWHKEFKGTAAFNGISMKDLLTESFEAWKKANPDRALK